MRIRMILAGSRDGSLVAIVNGIGTNRSFLLNEQRTVVVGTRTRDLLELLTTSF